MSTVLVARALYCLVDGGGDRSWKRCVCPETQLGSDKCNAAIVPQPLNGALLNRPDGGAPALNCLKQNLANLSPGAKRPSKRLHRNRHRQRRQRPLRVKRLQLRQRQVGAPSMPAPSAPTATAQPSAAGTGKPSQAQLRSVRQSCGADYRIHCAGIPPGGSASIACLKRNITTLTGTCKQALGAVVGGATAAAVPAVAPPPVELAPLFVSPREELFILRMACGGDYAAFCRGLRPAPVA